MYFGAISTDIKKSSTLWSNFPAWMKLAVMYTNNITEYVFNKTELEGVQQLQLPNSPEGDAYTFFYQCEDQDKLIKHVKHVGHILQNVYRVARDRNILRMTDEAIDGNIKNKLNIDFVKKQEFFHAVFVRIGIAFSDIAPIEYTYTVGQTYEDTHVFKSYWESVIAESERAESKGAPYKDGIGVTQEGAKVIKEDTTDENSRFMVEEESIKIDGESVSLPIESIALAEAVYGRQRSDDEPVNGYMIFIHYHLHIQWEDVQRDTHLYRPMVEEFRQVHEQTKITMENDFPGKLHLVKVKRSSDSMFFLDLNVTKKNTNGWKMNPQPSTVWKRCLQLASHLPTGSSIGISYTCGNSSSATPSGSLNRVVDREKFQGYSRIDFFGDCVNLAARMAGVDWCYKTEMFKSGKNDHKSRVALCNADNTNKGWKFWKLGEGNRPGASTSKFITPIFLEDIPRETLNAGTGHLRTISAHVYLGQNIQLGDEVKWCGGENNDIEMTGRVVMLLYLIATIETPNNEIVKKNITYLEKIRKPPLQEIAPPLPKRGNKALKLGIASLKF